MFKVTGGSESRQSDPRAQINSHGVTLPSYDSEQDKDQTLKGLTLWRETDGHQTEIDQHGQP